MLELSYADYLDKVRGGWFGKCLGGAAGAPFEGIKKIIRVENFAATMNPELPNDDLDLQLLWVQLLQERGFAFTQRDMADAWERRCSYAMSEYGYFMKNHERGIAPPLSGSFNNEFFSGGNGCPIRSELWGFIFPGNPDLAARYAGMDGSLDHSGDAVHIERFYSAMESLCFFESDPERLLIGAAAYLPEGTQASRCLNDVLSLRARFPGEALRAREAALRKYGHHDFTHAVTNFAFVLIALLYGGGDLRRTIDVALSCGFDTDCTCATAAAILGAARGYSAIDPELVTLCGDGFVVGIDLPRSDNTIVALAREVCELGAEAAATMNRACRILGLPRDFQVPARPLLSSLPAASSRTAPRGPAGRLVSLDVAYPGAPAIGIDDTMEFSITVANDGAAVFSGSVAIEGVPKGWLCQSRESSVLVGPGERASLSNRLFTPPSVRSVRNANHLLAVLRDDGGTVLERLSFGAAGASVWKLAGPFFVALDKPEEHPEYPSPHAPGCSLPTLECMVNNDASLDAPYIDETDVVGSVAAGDYVLLNAYEDLIPVDDAVSYRGQACFYLSQLVVSPEARDVWIVIGNNDGFVLRLNGTEVLKKDEMRLWTPYNNAALVHLKEGTNAFALKLLRRGELLRFSIGFRKYEGKHWHQQRWLVDMESRV